MSEMKQDYFPLYKSAKERVFTLENELAEARKQLAGCAVAARDYDAARQYGEGVGFGDEFKKVLVCRQSLDSVLAQLNMAVSRIRGIVEGLPTGRHNFLQRIDELVAIESQHSESTVACGLRSEPAGKESNDE